MFDGGFYLKKIACFVGKNREFKDYLKGLPLSDIAKHKNEK